MLPSPRSDSLGGFRVSMHRHFPSFILLLCVTTHVFAQQVVTRNEPALRDTLMALEAGVVVEDVKPRSAADRAGLQVDDVILRWSRAGRHQELESPFDVLAVEVEEGARGTVTLQGTRNNLPQVWTVEADSWGLKTRPRINKSWPELQKTGSVSQNDWIRQAAVGLWPEDLKSDLAQLLRAWVLWRFAGLLAREKAWGAADAACGKAAEQLNAVRPANSPFLLRTCGEFFLEQDNSVNADKYYRLALDSSEAKDRGSLSTAMILSGLGLVLHAQDDLPTSEEMLERAIGIQRRLVPGSLALASTLNRLGVFLQDSGDLERSAQYLEESIGLREKLDPGSYWLAATLENLGNTLVKRGDLDRANTYLMRALNLWEKIDPEGLTFAGCLVDSSNAMADQGDFVRAELFLRRALAIQMKLSPNGGGAAASMNNLGLVLIERGEFEEAGRFFTQSLQRTRPGTLAAAINIENLGDVARERSDYAESEKLIQQVLEIRTRLAPKSLELAVTYSGMGDLQLRRRNLAAAEELYHKALAIEEQSAPAGHEHANTLKMLGDLMLERGDLAGAEQNYTAALKLEEGLRWISTARVEIILALADLKLRKGELQSADQLFRHGLSELEERTSHLGGAADVRSGFRARFDVYYRDYVDLLVTQGQPELALEIFERSRARSLVEMLAEAHVDIRRNIDPDLLKLANRLQGEIRSKVNRRIDLLTGSHSDAQVTAVTKEIEDLTAEYRSVQGQIRISSPGYAALVHPTAITVRQLQEQVLDADTLLLEYCLGNERSYVWLVSKTHFAAYQLPKRTEIEEAARRYYEAITMRQDSQRLISSPEVAPQRNSRLVESARALSKMVLGPVSGLLHGQRLIVISDGALQYVPFAALPQPRSGQATSLARNSSAPLAAEYEIVALPSASVLIALRAQAAERTPGSRLVAVFADPVFGKNDERVASSISTASEPAGEPATRERLSRSLRDISAGEDGSIVLPRLSFTRREAHAIFAVTPKDRGWEALDFDASRQNITSHDLADYQIVHIATHGLVDSKSPELSGLVFSLVDRQGNSKDGFLGLQDIYNLNLRAELVVLSACETALGKEIQGEGFIGLTRGFMYAGASRVIASLWKADDVGTMAFMTHFYKGMEQDGLRPAAALRKAQLQMSREKRWADPYFWAGFQIQGEWR